MFKLYLFSILIHQENEFQLKSSIKFTLKPSVSKALQKVSTTYNQTNRLLVLDNNQVKVSNGKLQSASVITVFSILLCIRASESPLLRQYLYNLPINLLVSLLKVSR